MNKKRKLGFWPIVLFAILVMLVFSEDMLLMSAETYSYPQFVQDIKAKSDEMEQIIVIPNNEVPTGSIQILWIDGTKTQCNVTDVNAVVNQLEAEGVTQWQIADMQKESWLERHGGALTIAAVILVVFLAFAHSQNGGANAKMANFGKSRAKMSDEKAKDTTFKKVAGLEEEKEELQEIVDFLKNPQRYTDLGARIPKGVILVGPPGTGKTLLAKAVAGEAGVPFFSISGSDFVEMFVGVGASRVRDLFEDAKKNAPCIVFIDEIDAVARRRGTGMGGGHDEREQTLNQLLVEMDGFGVNQGIIVMAATNRVDILDPAILRPGRFDRKVGIGRPDIKGRREILNVHTKGKPLGDDVDLDQIAQTTAGFTGADLENLMNESAIMAARERRAYITQADIQKAFVKVGIGTEKKSRVISDKEKRITAYHEAGHAILFHVLPDVGPVYTVSIIPTGIGAAGYTMPLPEKDQMFYTKGRMLQDIMVSLGGRIAEDIIFGDITTGASQDIKHATRTARAMVTEYGMSDAIGMINYGGDGDEVFIGRDLAHTKSYSESVATVIDQEVKGIVDAVMRKQNALLWNIEMSLKVAHSFCLKKKRLQKKNLKRYSTQLLMHSWIV